MWLDKEFSVSLRGSTPSGIGVDNTYCRCSSRKLIDKIWKNLKGMGFDV